MVNGAIVADLICTAPPLDVRSQSAVQARIDDILRPTGALARLDELVVWLAGVQATPRPAITAPTAMIFAADHGVAAEGVSAYPAEVTASMMRAFDEGVSSISAMARVAGATVSAVDVGVGLPTGNIAVEAAMSHDRFEEAFIAGRDAIAPLDTDLLIIGEMGIGNTTAAAAVVGCLLGLDDSVGAGTGVSGAALARKRLIVAEAVARVDSQTEPIEVLRQLGGLELAAMAGALVESRLRSIPVLLDGFVVSAAALAVARSAPDALVHCWAAHRSREPGHAAALEALDMTPLLELDMALGEGSGAMAALPLVKMACALVSEVPTFAEFFAS
ncbi:MAG: nicotinate-nucleotide--dimethylbenzimidazole phosphoribosyltransferase [Acidobacteria bacterium]|nr:nicotinate-nucleotide--dimethylbenzimidazole phosphoribosyltransferase [Acidobacteriota bacterium]